MAARKLKIINTTEKKHRKLTRKDIHAAAKRLKNWGRWGKQDEIGTLNFVTPDMIVAREEIFGPVLCVMPYGTEDEAVDIANGTPYGLAAAVWSADQDHAVAVARKLRAGQVEINGGAFNAVAPFGGFGQSGYGRELGVHGLEEFLEVKALQF